jgi:hypothetical protein
MGQNNSPRIRHMKVLVFFGLLISCLWMLAACSSAAPTEGVVKITIAVDQRQIETQAPAGATIQSALDSAGITLSNLDRVDPPTYSLITNPVTVKVTRVKETFQIEEQVLPFSQQQVKNESLPQGQTLLIQAGANGVQQVTYRHVFEDGVEVSQTPVKNVIITDPKPEIIMVGVQTPFTAIPITHKLAYLTAGNAWVMQSSTGERKPIVSSGDLDGHVFSLSPDGKWLLYTRKSTKPASEEINSLWAIDIVDENSNPINLKVNNIVHFADWVPGAPNTVIYSTVEPRVTAPGWQANNDLQRLVFAATGTYVRNEEIIQANSGGIYGWWGTVYSWSQDGKKLAYARPDSIGLVDLVNKKLIPIIDVLPFQPRGDWAWVPGLSLSPDNSVIYAVTHPVKSGLSSVESSPVFNLSAVAVDKSLAVDLAPQSGMFAYPSASPMLAGKRFWLTYLQAIFPERSDTSRYRLVIVQRDGSNRKIAFPPEGSSGLEPQEVVWSPLPADSSPLWLALIYQGNLWLIDPASSHAQQITGDGLISRIDWK